MNHIIIDPEYLKLIKEIKLLKEEIAILYQEKDKLIYHTCKSIEIEYMSRVGVLEYKLYEFQYKILRIKGKIELYQSKINKQKKPNEKEIEEELEAEYKAYEEKLNKLLRLVQEVLTRKDFENLSEEDDQELKRIYRKFIKKLHPDLNKENSEKNINLLLQVTFAYEHGDLETLKNLEVLTDEIIERENIEIGEFEDLKELKEKYISIIQELLRSIKKIKNSFPYNKKDFLRNDVLVQERKEELLDELDRCKETYLNLENMLNQLRG